jgi:hypothetical protein
MSRAEKSGFDDEIEPLCVSIKQAGTALGGQSKSTIYKLIGAGKLESTLIGTRRVVIYKPLKALIKPAEPPGEAPARHPPPPPTFRPRVAR